VFLEFIKVGIQPFMDGRPHPKSQEFMNAGAQAIPPDDQERTQLYETDVSPVAVNSAPIIEVFRISLEDVTKEIEVKKAWKVLVNALVHTGASMPQMSGKSVNLADSLYLGVLGWESLEVCCKYDMAFDTANILRNMIVHIRNSM
jgi:hypothetical protein